MMIRRFLSSGLSHLNKDGLTRVVDVSSKDITKRIAVAGCKVILPEKVANELKLHHPKSNVELNFSISEPEYFKTMREKWKKKHK